MRLPAFTAAARPDTVLRVGDLPPSGPLRRWLAELDAVQVVIDPEGAWPDPAHVADLSVAADPAPLLTGLAGRLQPATGPWLGAWRDADTRAAKAVDATLGADLSEPQVSRQLVRHLPGDATIFVAASMPVRDLETFGPARDVPLRILSNRGANGIDGTIATAYGVAAASDGPVVLLLGDVAFAHDLGSLLTARRIGVPLTIVLIDNAGGGIFDFLPIATQEDVYGRTSPPPPGWTRPLPRPVRPASPPGGHRPRTAGGGRARHHVGGTTLVHVRTDRADNLALHRAVWDAVGASLAG